MFQDALHAPFPYGQGEQKNGQNYGQPEPNRGPERRSNGYLKLHRRPPISTRNPRHHFKDILTVRNAWITNLPLLRFRPAFFQVPQAIAKLDFIFVEKRQCSKLENPRSIRIANCERGDRFTSLGIQDIPLQATSELNEGRHDAWGVLQL